MINIQLLVKSNIASFTFFDYSEQRMPVQLVNIENCVGCGACAEQCPCGVLKLDEAQGKMTIVDISACCDCQSCNVCPQGVISYN